MCILLLVGGLNRDQRMGELYFIYDTSYDLKGFGVLSKLIVSHYLHFLIWPYLVVSDKLMQVGSVC